MLYAAASVLALLLPWGEVDNGAMWPKPSYDQVRVQTVVSLERSELGMT